MISGKTSLLGALAAAALVSSSMQAAGQARGYAVIAGEHEEPSLDGHETASVPSPSSDSPSILVLPDTNSEEMEKGIMRGEAAARPMTEAEKNVRVVGSKFLPDPEEAINLRAPAPTPVR